MHTVCNGDMEIVMRQFSAKKLQHSPISFVTKLCIIKTVNLLTDEKEVTFILDSRF